MQTNPESAAVEAVAPCGWISTDDDDFQTFERDPRWAEKYPHKWEPVYPKSVVSALDALRGEVAELREELERSRRDYELLANESIYDGNSIGWIASKAKKYGDALLEAWQAVRDVGGTCDGNTPLHEAIRKQLTKVTP